MIYKKKRLTNSSVAGKNFGTSAVETSGEYGIIVYTILLNSSISSLLRYKLQISLAKKDKQNDCYVDVQIKMY